MQCSAKPLCLFIWVYEPGYRFIVWVDRCVYPKNSCFLVLGITFGYSLFLSKHCLFSIIFFGRTHRCAPTAKRFAEKRQLNERMACGPPRIQQQGINHIYRADTSLYPYIRRGISIIIFGRTHRCAPTAKRFAEKSQLNKRMARGPPRIQQQGINHIYRADTSLYRYSRRGISIIIFVRTHRCAPEPKLSILLRNT